jgi:hypothetical protein
MVRPKADLPTRPYGWMAALILVLLVLVAILGARRLQQPQPARPWPPAEELLPPAPPQRTPAPPPRR